MSGEPGNEVRPASRPALSPSRAADFKQCPLLYRFRAIDRLPEPPSTAQLRGSVVHVALEQLYNLPATERGPQTADALVGPAWEQVIGAEPELAAALDAEQQTQLLDEARALLSGYYRLEDPTRFDPQSCEQRIRSSLPTAHCCGGSSTGSMSPPPANCGSWTTRPARRLRRRGSSPSSRPCSR
jgi:putative RecB family exonuclease